MAAKRQGPSGRRQALAHLDSAHADGHPDERGPEDAAGLVRPAGAQKEPGVGPVGSPMSADSARPSGLPRPVRVRDRVGDWLVRALRRAVFCWLPPPHG